MNTIFDFGGFLGALVLGVAIYFSNYIALAAGVTICTFSLFYELRALRRSLLNLEIVTKKNHYILEAKHPKDN